MSWNDWVLNHEIEIRLSFFLGVFAIMASWEMLRPRRVLTVSKLTRWVNNLALVVFNSLLLRLLFPVAAVGVAAMAAEHGWGLLNVYPLPFIAAVVIAVVALDFVIYMQHVMVHAIPVLWRLHRVHHADLDYDVTTGNRFHPLEIILSMLIKFAAVLLLGAPVVAVVIFEVILNAMASFNHSNVLIPVNIDRLLRLFIVTPDMHRVHHSTHAPFANSNFGFNLPWWDRLMGTYVAQPPEGHIEMEIGLNEFRDVNQVNKLPGMLALPFVRKLGEYTINRRW